MKIRNGFVSNSSSSSFIIMTDHTKDEVKKILKRIINDYNETHEKQVKFSDVFKFTTVDDNVIELYKDFGIKKVGNAPITKLRGRIEIRSEHNSLPYDCRNEISETFQTSIMHLG